MGPPSPVLGPRLAARLLGIVWPRQRGLGGAGPASTVPLGLRPGGPPGSWVALVWQGGLPSDVPVLSSVKWGSQAP